MFCSRRLLDVDDKKERFVRLMVVEPTVTSAQISINVLK